MTKKSSISREQALELLRRYNKEPFHIQHALTVEGVMRWYAREMGYGEEEEFWGIQDCFMILILSFFRRSTAKRRRNFCGKQG